MAAFSMMTIHPNLTDGQGRDNRCVRVGEREIKEQRQQYVIIFYLCFSVTAYFMCVRRNLVMTTYFLCVQSLQAGQARPGEVVMSADTGLGTPRL